MRPCDLKSLEFHKVLEALARWAASEPGRAACLALRPATDPEQVRERLARQADLVRLVNERGPLPLQPFSDISRLLTLARHEGAMLSGPQLLEILNVIRLARLLRAYLRPHADRFASLAGLARSLRPLPELESALAQALDQEGRLKDQASPALAEIRRTIKELRQEVEERLKRLLHSPAHADVIADHYVTIRNNRFVIPVKPHFGQSLPGIVQDRSASGETYFIEPLFAVEINNRQMIAIKEEEAEERRLLVAFTTWVGRSAAEIEEGYAALVRADVLAAAAAFAIKLRCTKPDLSDDDIELRQARHPLLELTGRTVVPVDIRVGGRGQGLVISGPNTGGKTVALKTVGLLTLMAQSGLLVPAAEGTRVACCKAVLADLVDEQSIERNLSTFSSHISNLVDIFARLKLPSLVLLDEPGVGTDPEEGALIAVGLLSALTRAGALVVVATHYRAVKLLALDSPNYQMAAVDFDPVSLQPRYRLVYGSIGESLGLAVAARLGLPAEVIDTAHQRRSKEGEELRSAVEKMEEARREYEELAAELERERARAREAFAEHQALAAELRERKRRYWQTELAAARAFLQDLKAQGRELLSVVRRRPDAAAALGAFVAEKRAEVAAREEEIAPGAGGPEELPVVGDLVEVAGKGIRGELSEVFGERARIVRGGLRFEVKLGDLRRIGVPDRKKTTVKVPEHGGIPLEIDLTGLRVGDALRRLEEFLDRAQLAGHAEVRVIHGIGTGALKRAVLDYLATSPYCAAHREADQGAGGVTVVELLPQA